MKRLTFKIASAALGLSLCLGASASPSIPVSLAPGGGAKPNAIIIVTGPHYVVVVTRAVQRAMLHNVDQSAQFDRTN